MYTTIADEPNMIVLGHGNIGSAFATQFRTVCGRNVVAIVGRSGGSIVIPNDAILSQFAQQSNDQKRESLDATITLDGLVEDFGGKDRVVIIDASSNSDPNAHTELFEKGFRIISANKNPLGLGDISTAQQMLSSNTYG